jgi:hypothetical protein
VADLVAEVAEQRAVGLFHGDPELFAVYVVALGKIECGLFGGGERG